MDSKLILVLDKQVIDRAKKYASFHKTTLSRLVESYLKTLIDKDPTQSENEISPFVKSIQTGKKIPADLDDKNEYIDYLTEKYK
jgi:hypothetical protein